MSDNWCGCGNYQSCNLCFNNPNGDEQIEKKRQMDEVRDYQRREISRLYVEIQLLTQRKRMLEMMTVKELL